MKEVRREAERRKVELLVVPTPQAIEALEQEAEERDPPRDIRLSRRSVRADYD